MKRILLSAWLVICFSMYATTVAAIPVKIISSNMSVSGSYIIAGGSPGGGGYSFVGSTPQSGSITYPDYDIVASSSADYFSVFAYVNHGVHDPDTDASASAWTKTEFKSLIDFSYLPFNVDFEAQYGDFSASLFDVTNNVTVWSVYAFSASIIEYTYYPMYDPSNTFEPPPSAINYEFQAGNVYRINLSTSVEWTHFGNTGGFGGLQAVPEPATMLLLGLGLVGLAGVRKRL